MIGINKSESFYNYLLNVFDNLQEALVVLDGSDNVCLWNLQAEHITGFHSDSMLLQPLSLDFFLLNRLYSESESESESITPLSWSLFDSISTTGSVLNKRGERVDITINYLLLFDSSGKVNFKVFSFSEKTITTDMLQRVKSLEKMAYVDVLTGLVNRRFLMESIEQRIEEYKRYNWSFAIFLTDIDCFKQINDSYGHNAGDKVIQRVSEILKKCMRNFDVVGRLGGDEMLGIAINVKSQELDIILTRLNHQISSTSIDIGGYDIKVTLSIGATLVKSDDTVKSIIERADKFMYTSKRNGRNRVTVG